MIHERVELVLVELETLNVLVQALEVLTTHVASVVLVQHVEEGVH